MNYYSFHIGDYVAHTKHLTLIEDLVYRRMLDLYYMSEKPLPLEPEKVARLICMRDHVQEVSDVLSEFFLRSEEGYTNSRCSTEIATYQARIEHSRAAGKLGGRPRKNPEVSLGLSDEKGVVIPVETQGKGNQEPGTINQEPLTINPDESKPTASSRGTRLANDWTLPRIWGEWAVKERTDLTRKDILALADEFKDYWIGVPGARGLKRDWFATWRNKIRNAQKRSPQHPYRERFNALAYVTRNMQDPEDEKVIEH